MPGPRLETGLRDSQIIQRNAPLPEEVIVGPRWGQGNPARLMMMRNMMGDQMFKLLMYNKNCEDRICPGCMTKYNVLSEAEGQERTHEEQRLSGICSLQCWVRLNGADDFDAQEWLGTAASSATITVRGDEVSIEYEVPARDQ